MKSFTLILVALATAVIAAPSPMDEGTMVGLGVCRPLTTSVTLHDHRIATANSSYRKKYVLSPAIMMLTARVLDVLDAAMV